MKLKDSQLFETLRTFSKAEFSEFCKFADSPYFNRGRNYLPFLKEIRKFHPDYSSESFSAEYIYGKLYPGRKFNTQVFKNLAGGLMRIAEEYLVQFGIKRQRSEYLLQLSEELQHRRITRAAGKLIKKTHKHLEESKYDTLYFGKMFRLLKSEAQYLRNKNDFKGMSQLERRSAAYLFFQFFTEFGYAVTEIKAIEANLNINIKNEQLYKFAGSKAVNEFLSVMRSRADVHQEVIEIYSLMVKLAINQTDEATFSKMNILFKNNLDKFNRIGMHQLFILLISACNRLESIDKDKYRRISFELMKQMVERDAYSAEIYIPMNLATFRNIFICSISLNEFRWGENFLENYIDKILPEHRDNMYNYSMSRLCFEKNEPDKALTYLGKVKYDMFALKYDVKVLLLRIYYELGLYEQAYSHIDTFRHFINENRLLSPRKKNVQKNFLKFTEALLKIKHGKGISGISKLRSEINGSDSVVEKSWLLKKAGELDKTGKKFL